MTPDQVKIVQDSFAKVAPIADQAATMFYDRLFEVAPSVKAEHYPVVGSALLWTLEQGLGEAWTAEVAAAWTAAYGTLSGYMISEAYGRSQAAE